MSRKHFIKVKHRRLLLKGSGLSYSRSALIVPQNSVEQDIQECRTLLTVLNEKISEKRISLRALLREYENPQASVYLLEDIQELEAQIDEYIEEMERIYMELEALQRANEN